MTTKFIDLFNTEERNLAVKAIAYYDGKSKEYLEQYLNVHRHNALSKGMTPVTINTTKEIVDKSGMLFAGRAPIPSVFPIGANAVDEDNEAGQALRGLLDKAQWIEFFNNLDPVVRMLKTAMVLIQHDSTTNETFFTTLTQANSAVHSVNRKVETLIYFTGTDGDIETYRIWTKDLVQDLEISRGGEETITSVVPNPYGIIPIAVFHDTNLPRDGNWNPIPEDLITINSMMNLHMTDGAYAIAHAKLQTLFTNAQIQGSEFASSSTVVDYGSKLGPRYVQSSGQGFVGGPGEAVAIDTGGETVFLEYKGPNPNIEPLDTVMKGWMKDYARGWSVAIENEATGLGGAVSGFALVIKELPNMELRKKRARMFEAGFRELYEVLLKISEVFNLGLVQSTELFMQFTPPELPVDEQVSEQIWTMKIREKRATLIDYFVIQHGMSRQEARTKAEELAADAAFLTGLSAPPTPSPINATEVIETTIVK